MQTKSCLLAFRLPNSLEKRVNRLVFRTTSEHVFVDFEYSNNNVRKSVKCTYVEASSRSHVSETENSFQIVASAKTLYSGFQHFIKGVEYVVMVATPESVSFQNYDIQASNKMNTNFKFHRNEFEDIVAQRPVKLIFSLRCLKILLNFMDPKTSLLTMFFVDSGSPLFTKTSHKHYNAKLALATLQDPKILGDENISLNRDYLSEFNITESQLASGVYPNERCRQTNEIQPIRPQNSAGMNNEVTHSFDEPPCKNQESGRNLSQVNSEGDNGFQSHSAVEQSIEEIPQHITEEISHPETLESRFRFPISDENIINTIREITANIDLLPKQFHNDEDRRVFLGNYAALSPENEDNLIVAATDSELAD